MLASYTVANGYLDGTKLSFADDSAAALYAAAADAVVLAYLAPIFPAHASLWDATTPLPGGKEASPLLVQQISGMLMASIYYRKKFSESQAGDVVYATELRNEAMSLLMQLQAGTIDLSDVPDTSSSITFSRSFFYPNDNTPFDDHTQETDVTKEDHLFTLGAEF